MIKFEFTVEEVNIIIAALRKAPLPHEVSDPFMRKISDAANTQLQEQQKQEQGGDDEVRQLPN